MTKNKEIIKEEIIKELGKFKELNLKKVKVIKMSAYYSVFIQVEAQENLTIKKYISIERKVKSTLSSFILMFDSIEYTNGEIQDDVIEYGQYLSDVYSIYKKLNIDTANDVIDCLEKRLCSVSVIKPKEKKEL